MGPRRPSSERSDDRKPEYSPSGTSLTSPVSPPPTVSGINSTLSVARGSVRRCSQAPPYPPPLRSPYQVTAPPCSLQVHVEASRKNQLCPHWPLNHRHHHIPNCCVVEQCQVTVGPIALSCIRFYHPTMVVVVVVVVVALGAGRPPCGPLPHCHPPNGENTKAWVLIADDDCDPNNRSHSWMIR